MAKKILHGTGWSKTIAEKTFDGKIAKLSFSWEN